MTEETRSGRARLVCHHCSDVIGVYEPLVFETPAGWHVTSLAADPDLYESDLPCYHRTCYEQTHEDV